jgi:YfiH family protein
MADLKKWLKKTKKQKEWYEFSFNPKVKLVQGTKYFNPLREVKGEIVALTQIHSSITHKARAGLQLVGDGLFTNEEGLNLYIRTADCLPIIFYHQEEKILALLHAGWKGTVLMIAKKFLLKMKQLYNLNYFDWEVALGPCIALPNYEVGKGVFEFFNKFDIYGIKLKNGRYFLDLEEANIKILKKYGISKIYPFPEKTFTSELFYSYRKGDRERNITVGVIES